jgi:hypothetical protein
VPSPPTLFPPPLTLPQVALRPGGTADLSFERGYVCDPGSPLHVALAAALRSPAEDDAEIVFHVLQRDDITGKEVAVGTARCERGVGLQVEGERYRETGGGWKSRMKGLGSFGGRFLLLSLALTEGGLSCRFCPFFGPNLTTNPTPLDFPFPSPAPPLRYNLEDFLHSPATGSPDRLPPTALPILSPSSAPVGSLTLALSGRSALAPAAAAASAAASLSVRLSSLSVTSASARDSARSLAGRGGKPTFLVVVDALGVQEDSSDKVEMPAKGGGAALAFSKEYSLERGMPMRKAVEEALKSEDESDSEVGGWVGRSGWG